MNLIRNKLLFKAKARRKKWEFGVFARTPF
jgi:hypothetical protein